MGRTFAVGDIHGDIEALTRLLKRLPKMTADDTLLFIGDFVDRGPASREVVKLVRSLPTRATASDRERRTGAASETSNPQADRPTLSKAVPAASVAGMVPA